jgi:alpha-beta hydrolase superfamily lysophospholipase
MVFLKTFIHAFSVVAFAFMFGGCASMVTQPTDLTYSEPKKVVFQTPQELWIHVEDDIKLHAWWFRAKSQNSQAVVLQFHGNAENMTSHYQSVAWMLNHDLDVVTFDYRGYGQSGGKDKLSSIMNDASKVVRFVSHLYQMQNKPIWLYGQSLGSLVSAQALVQLEDEDIPIEGWIIEGGMDSLTRTAQDMLSQHWFSWAFQPLGHVLLPSRYNMRHVVDKVGALPPILLLHSEQDPIIPIEQAHRLKSRLAQDTCMIRVKEKTHINVGNVANGKYRQSIEAFIKRGQCKQP